MQDNRKNAIVFAIFLLFIAGGFIGQGLWLALLPLCLFIAIKGYPFAEKRFSNVDLFVIIVCIAEILACAFSSYIPNSIRSLEQVLLVASFWFFFRAVLSGEKQYNCLIMGGSCLALVFSLITIVTFINFRSVFSLYEGASLTDFKQEFRPLNLPVNDWVSYTLCLLPYPLEAAFGSEIKWKCILHLSSAAMLIASVFLSLSRGAYLALFVFIVAAVIALILFRCEKTKRYLVFICIAVLAGMVVVLPAKDDVLTTCSMSGTTSQKLSTTGRVQLINDAVALWKESPVLGVGQGNFNIIYDGTITDRKASHTRATNAYALILVERGIVGLLAYFGLVLVTLTAGFRRMKKDPDIILFEVCFAAMCVRGLFFSSLFNHKFVFVLMTMIMFILIQEEDKYEIGD